MNVDLSIFKDYDIRGVYPTQLNSEVVKAIAYGLVRHFHPQTVVICRDMRLSGGELRAAMTDVFTRQGITVYDAGLTGTEMQYFMAGTYPYDLFLMISASHNPKEYNGLKVAQRGPASVTSDSGLFAVRDLIKEGPLPDTDTLGEVKEMDVFPKWKQKILSLVDISHIKPFSVVVDAGNGMAGKLMPYVFNTLPTKITPLYFELDGSFPNHTPNPLYEKNTIEIRKKIVEIGADLGFAFDGDADRTFLFDDRGKAVSATITTALLAKYFLKKHPGKLILYNAICGRVVPKVIADAGGTSKRVRVGHSYIKQYMKQTGAIFAGEHSGHYYYRDYFLAESGVLTALTILQLLSFEGRKLSQLVTELDIYPSSGEMNFTSTNIPNVIETIKKNHQSADRIDELDGISVWYKTYWFNIRASKTEPLLRLNIEADTKEILETQKQKIIEEIQSLGATQK